MLIIYLICSIIMLTALIWGLCHKSSEENRLKVFKTCMYCTIITATCGMFDCVVLLLNNRR